MLEILELSDLKEKPSNYAPFTPPTVLLWKIPGWNSNLMKFRQMQILRQKYVLNLETDRSCLDALKTFDSRY